MVEIKQKQNEKKIITKKFEIFPYFRIQSTEVSLCHLKKRLALNAFISVGSDESYACQTHQCTCSSQSVDFNKNKKIYNK